MRRLLWPLVAISLLAPGCSSSDDDDDGPTDATTPVDTGVDSGVDTGVDSGSPDRTVPDMGTNTGPTVVETGDPYGEPGVIDPAGDQDMFQFQGTAGQWLHIVTRSGGSPIDPVITLFDSEMTKIAENDDDIPRTGTDSEINFHVPEDGIYYVNVQEFSSFDPEGTPVGGPDYVFTLRVLFWDDATAGVVIDPESGDDAASATPDEFGTVLGTFRDTDDVDVYRVRIASSTTARYEVNVLPFGPDAQGPTSPVGDVWLTDVGVTETIARVNNAAGFASLEPPVTPGEYLLWISHPGTALGTNDYYVLRPGLFVENTLELGAPNEDLATAQQLTIEDDGTTRSAFLLARLTTDDVDYYEFPDVVAEEMFSVACSAESAGSGVRGLTVEVRDSTDTVLEMQTEDMDGVFILPFSPTSLGTLYVRLSAAAPAADVTSRFVRCGMRAALPAP